jgi:hypothetical protein
MKYDCIFFGFRRSELMKPAYYAYLLITVSMAVLLAGCGAGGTSPETKIVLQESAACISCHEDTSWQTPGTGKNIVTEWKLSTHNTQNGASCADCHDDGHMHPSSCNKCHNSGVQARNPTNNPDRDGKCAKCHDKSGGFRFSFADGIFINIGTAHFTNLTSATIIRSSQSLYYTNYTSSVNISSAARGTAVWASSFYNPVKGDTTKYGCRACHNPHDTSSQIGFHRSWSRSGHGDPNSGARTGRDFKTFGSTLPASVTMSSICVRCHTSTGFINYVQSDFNTVTALAPAESADHTKEVTGCNVCHDDGAGFAYSYKLRNVLAVNPGRTGVPAYYNYSASRGGGIPTPPFTTTDVNVSLTYPDASSSNVCIVCHMGREVGLSVKMAYLQGVKFNGTGRLSAHDFAAGANLFQESGFEFYTSSAKYPQTAFLHNQAGLGNINGTGTNGPCIACHMSRPTAADGRKSADSHTFMPITKAFKSNGRVESITSSACNKCHPAAAAGKTMDATTLEKNRLGFLAAMQTLRDLIRTKIAGVTMNTKTGALSFNSNTNWRSACGGVDSIVTGSGNPATGGADAIGSAAYTMGSAFNYELLYADFGAYVHNPNYIKRLIFDSYDWLTNCSMTIDNGSTECAGITDPIAKAYLCPVGKRP